MTKAAKVERNIARMRLSRNPFTDAILSVTIRNQVMQDKSGVLAGTIKILNYYGIKAEDIPVCLAEISMTSNLL